MINVKINESVKTKDRVKIFAGSSWEETLENDINKWIDDKYGSIIIKNISYQAIMSGSSGSLKYTALIHYTETK